MLNEPEKAEGYLHDAVKMFKAEGWEMLADDTRMDIAWCQKATNQTQKYELLYFDIYSFTLHTHTRTHACMLHFILSVI